MSKTIYQDSRVPPTVLQTNPSAGKILALEIIKMLSALESWCLSSEKPFPDYMHDNLCILVNKLTEEVLKE